MHEYAVGRCIKKYITSSTRTQKNSIVHTRYTSLISLRSSLLSARSVLAVSFHCFIWCTLNQYKIDFNGNCTRTTFNAASTKQQQQQKQSPEKASNVQKKTSHKNHAHRVFSCLIFRGEHRNGLLVFDSVSPFITQNESDAQQKKSE